MKKIVVISDTHGNASALDKLHSVFSEADMIIFTGDGLNDLKKLEREFGAKLIAVRGNCDYTSAVPSERLIEVEGHRLLITHGHNYGVKYGLDKLFFAAIEQGADAAVFGHTHNAEITERDGIKLINCGSLSYLSYSSSFIYMVITEQSITAVIREMNK